jgi:hypothetical protein
MLTLALSFSVGSLLQSHKRLKLTSSSYPSGKSMPSTQRTTKAGLSLKSPHLQPYSPNTVKSTFVRFGRQLQKLSRPMYVPDCRRPARS